MAGAAIAVGYRGPQCPHCDRTLDDAEIRTGLITCETCRKEYEATAFTPPEKRTRVLEVAVSGPEGANSCANHARNAAVTSCERCGLFICALCDMNVGEGSCCPSCFQRARTEGTLHGTVTRVRDYAGLARVSLVVGFLFLFFLGIPAGVLAIYYAVKGIGQRRAEGDSIVGPIIAIVVAIIEIVASGAFLALMIIGATQ